MKAYEIPYDLKTGNNKQAEIHTGIRLAKFVIYFSDNYFIHVPERVGKRLSARCASQFVGDFARMRAP